MDINITNTLEMPIWWPDYISVGIFFFVLGVTGAAIIVYLGRWDEFMENTARILELDEHIKCLKSKQSKAIDDTDKERLWQEMMKQQEELNKEKGFIRNMGIVIYLFVGGTVASIMANSMLEAVAIGAGWTGLIGAFGIKKNADERMKRADKDASQDARTADMITKKHEKINKEHEEKTIEAYSDGYADAIETAARVMDIDSKDLTEKIIKSLEV